MYNLKAKKKKKTQIMDYRIKMAKMSSIEIHY